MCSQPECYLVKRKMLQMKFHNQYFLKGNTSFLLFEVQNLVAGDMVQWIKHWSLLMRTRIQIPRVHIKKLGAHRGICNPPSFQQEETGFLGRASWLDCLESAREPASTEELRKTSNTNLWPICEHTPTHW